MKRIMVTMLLLISTMPAIAVVWNNDVIPPLPVVLQPVVEDLVADGASEYAMFGAHLMLVMSDYEKGIVNEQQLSLASEALDRAITRYEKVVLLLNNAKYSEIRLQQAVNYDYSQIQNGNERIKSEIISRFRNGDIYGYHQLNISYLKTVRTTLDAVNTDVKNVRARTLAPIGARDIHVENMLALIRSFAECLASGNMATTIARQIWGPDSTAQR